jgi:cytochrome c biogenesis protein CcmG, thiol:disulfide interchange protein DsbE
MRYFALMAALLFAMALPAWAVDVQDFELKDLAGKDVELDDLLEDSSLLVLAFWEVGCVPCTEQLTHFQEYYEDYQDKGVEFVVISATPSMLLSKVEPFFKSMEFTFRVLEDVDREVTTDYGIKAPPAVFVISPDKDMLYQHYGYKPGQEKEVKSVIDKFLAENTEEK